MYLGSQGPLSLKGELNQKQLAARWLISEACLECLERWRCESIQAYECWRGSLRVKRLTGDERVRIACHGVRPQSGK